LTDCAGPDNQPVVSPDGARIAYVGCDDRYQGYQIVRLYVMERDGTAARPLTADFDRSIRNPQWVADGKGLYFSYADRRNTARASVDLPLISCIAVSAARRRFWLVQRSPSGPRLCGPKKHRRSVLFHRGGNAFLTDIPRGTMFSGVEETGRLPAWRSVPDGTEVW